MCMARCKNCGEWVNRCCAAGNAARLAPCASCGAHDPTNIGSTDPENWTQVQGRWVPKASAVDQADGAPFVGL